MRPRVSWMTQGDDAILEFFRDKDIAATPAVVAYNIDFSDGYVRRRMRRLLDEGLLELADDTKAMYTITDRGRQYLEGELSKDDLED